MHKIYNSKNYRSLEGKILVASPHLDDPYFRHSLIYVCAHDTSGAIGIIVNQKIGVISCADFLKSQSRSVAAQKKEIIKNKRFPLLFGGPVNTDMLLAISTNKNTAEKIHASDIEIHTDVTKFCKDISAGKIQDKFIMAKGVSAWDGQQLEAELSENTWFVISASVNTIFTQDSRKKWSNVIKQLGIGDFTSLVQYSGNA